MTEHLLDIGVTALRDGRTATIRPLAASDRASLIAFGRALPQHDLQYIEDDFLNPEVINRLINMCSAEHWRQFVATSGDAIVGYCAVRRLAGWSGHVGELHLVVSSGWRRSGLGSALALTMMEAARELALTQLVVEMLAEQDAGQAIFERLGFGIEGLLEDQVCDRYGRRHDLLVMGRRL
jgi:ribosomal protein S18 acetylase RimI-like enzyme